jgi:hypothetical protein
VSVLVVAQPISEVPEGLMNYLLLSFVQKYYIAKIKRTSCRPSKLDILYFCQILSKYGIYSQIMIKSPNITFQRNLSNGNRADTGTHTDI